MKSIRFKKISDMRAVVGHALATLLAAVVYVSAAPSPFTTSSFDMSMPNVQPTEPDTYLCNAVRIDEAHRYLVGFDPKANSHDAHHMLLFGCTEPGMAPGEAWNCGEMSSSSLSKSNYTKASVCQSGQNILYAWAMDAPKLNLPSDVAFDVGQDTDVKYLVLQVHYKNVDNFIQPKNGHDNSGLTIHTSSKRMSKQAGVYLLATGGFIPTNSIEYFEAACEYGEEKEIVPFAYRTHAHSLGRVISGYRVRDGKWTEIGRKDPRLPEMFYNVTNPGITVKKGDILAARCTMENTKDHDVEIGNTQNDEMCNFYVMYYVNSPPIPSNNQCVTPGPPTWYWRNFEDQQKLNLTGAPVYASVIPGTKTLLMKTTVDSSMPYNSEWRQDEEEGGNMNKEPVDMNDLFDMDDLRVLEQLNELNSLREYIKSPQQLMDLDARTSYGSNQMQLQNAFMQRGRQFQGNAYPYYYPEE